MGQLKRNPSFQSKYFFVTLFLSPQSFLISVGAVSFLCSVLISGDHGKSIRAALILACTKQNILTEIYPKSIVTVNTATNFNFGTIFCDHGKLCHNNIVLKCYKLHKAGGLSRKKLQLNTEGLRASCLYCRLNFMFCQFSSCSS